MNVTILKNDVNFLCGATSATYPDADKVRNMNIAYNDVARLIWESAGGWHYDDSNATTLPVAKTTLVHNQQDYSLPTDAQRLHRVEVKDKSGSWLKLIPLPMEDVTVALPAFRSDTGLPIYYSPVGRSVNLYPTPHSAYCTLASGVAFYVDRNITELATTATTTEPGFATPFHRILSYAASIDFEKDDTQKKFLVSQKDRLEKGLVRFYSKRFEEAPTTIKPFTRKRWQSYL